MRRVASLALAAALGMVGFVQANHNDSKYISVQGRLESGGSPVTTPTSTTIRLWDQMSGGMEVYSTGEFTAIPDGKGVFTHLLGPFESFDFHESRYMGVTITGEAEMAPRTQLTAAPYALAAHGLAWRDTVFVPGNSGANLQEIIDTLPFGPGTWQFTVFLGPGFHGVGEGLEMRQGVTLVGLSKDTTYLGSDGSASATTATVVMTDQTALENITVQCNGMGTAANCVGVRVEDSWDVQLNDITVWSNGATGDNIGIVITGSDVDPDLHGVSVSANTTDGVAIGLKVDGSGAEAFVQGGTFDAWVEGTGQAMGAMLSNAGSMWAQGASFIGEAGQSSNPSGLTMGVHWNSSGQGLFTGCQIEAFTENTGAAHAVHATGATQGLNLSGSTVIAFAEGASGGAIGLHALSGSKIGFQGGYILTDSANGTSHGLNASGAGSEARAIGSEIVADIGGNVSSSGTVAFGGSMINYATSSVAGSGTTTCVYSWDGSFATPGPTSCP